MFWEIVRRVLLAAVVLGLGALVASWLGGLVRLSLERSHLDPAVRRLVVLVIRPAVLTIAAAAALEQLGIDGAGVLVLVAAAGLSGVLALREPLGHAAAGAVILTVRPFEPDDLVEVAGETGTVIETGLLATRLRTGDGAEVTLPNALILAGPIRNRTRAAPAGDPEPAPSKARKPRARRTDEG